MHVLTYETHPDKFHDGLLKYTCNVNNIQLKVIGIGEKWISLKQKTLAVIDYLENVPEDEIVICCDNRDVIIPSTEEEIVAKFTEMEGDCYFSPELGGFPIWELEKHFPWPVNNTYRPEVRMLNAGSSIGYAGALIKAYKYSSRFFQDDFDLFGYLTSEYDISEKILQRCQNEYPARFGLIEECDQLHMQLTYLETDFIWLDYSYELLFTSFIIPSMMMPTEAYREKHLPEYPYGTLYDINFNWGSAYRSVYNTYNDTYPLIYHSPGTEYTISQLRKVVRG